MKETITSIVPMYAYIDPSVTSTVVAAVAGIAVVVVGAVAVYFRRAKKKVAKVLHIDENAGKEVEAEIEEIETK